MGNRVLFQVVATKGREVPEFGPAVYAHYGASDAHRICVALRQRMLSRGDDVEYASARLAQIAMGNDTGDTCFGIWNTDHVLTAKDTHGDGGVVLIHCDDGFRCECLGGKLQNGPDGFPV
jgi:hypothetical protein